MYKVFDRDAALERLLDDVNFLREMIKVFISEATKIITSIEEGTFERDPEKVRRYAHALKGCAANIGADELLSLAEKIENAIGDDNVNLLDQLSHQIRAGLEDFKLESARELN